MKIELFGKYVALCKRGAPVVTVIRVTETTHGGDKTRYYGCDDGKWYTAEELGEVEVPNE